MFKKMRAIIAKIPRGKVSTYGAVARAAGFPGASRQVAWALHGDSRGIPWQRVVGAKGKILLTEENGLEQRIRLEHEGVAFRGLRVDMKTHEFKFARPSSRKLGTAKKVKK